ncbi:hypothetical protein wVul_1228 [Wolbachia endosymbiont of Armadillidium vulgare str. wVulC]|uniref:hypothetical protein n=1 Tax=Wolbachia endosymbiont of Armadillidium vulgare TaxID=77039 RepID=UPI00064B4043|nr:hypothetical protein [Wolbachia endosymbiont of Armadillidium vulgare]KLT22294.1 hypothetical protein wVul_1228 [Wolbachia endosymbiont of Armadillidium vulgare str. wVulC]OJH31022.1 hypothetical protein Wxf_00396 [Wolbachia endosymbiont of Armadillidium vulgare]
MPKDKYVQPVYNHNDVPGGGKAYIDKSDKRYDDFSAKWQKKEQERKEQSKSSGQGSSKS